MGFAAILGLLAPIFTDMIKRIFPDPQQQAEAEYKMKELLFQAQAEASKAESILNQSKKEIIVTEMNTHSWFSDWRAKLMTMCTLMVGFNWIIAPILNSFLYFLNTQINTAAIPSEAWLLLNVGLGGYIGEKTMQTYSQGKVERAKAENPVSIDEDKLAKALRANLFKDGMTQSQWDAIKKSAEESVVSN